MSDSLFSILRGAPVVPLVQSDDPEEAVAISKALLAGGLNVLEVVLRTDKAFECLEAIAKAYPAAHVGAGTVLNAEQARKAIDHGATFIVSPGLDDGVVNVAKENKMHVLPGIATATELQRAWNMGLRAVKCFPAGVVGGPKMIKALSSAFRDMEFMPTGGVNPNT
ncbi:MAG: bifunctional 4-hydroxy-2-oxoglutarate aldolase/2-dehydro-3-deoxy-phosphogluconate aldolase, partial [Acidimicrobiales bacterium]